MSERDDELLKNMYREIWTANVVQNGVLFVDRNYHEDDDNRFCFVEGEGADSDCGAEVYDFEFPQCLAENPKELGIMFKHIDRVYQEGVKIGVRECCRILEKQMTILFGDDEEKRFFSSQYTTLTDLTELKNMLSDFGLEKQHGSGLVITAIYNTDNPQNFDADDNHITDEEDPDWQKKTKYYFPDFTKKRDGKKFDFSPDNDNHQKTLDQIWGQE